MNISIIGCGWMGEPLALELLKNGHLIKGTTRSVAKKGRLAAAGIETYLLDFDDEYIDESNLSPLFRSEIFFINLPPGRKNEDVEKDYPKRIEILLKNIVKQAHLLEGKKPWVIFASSSGVYGNQDCLLRETVPCHPERIGARAIYSAEELLSKYAPNIDATILRFAGLVGGNRVAGRFTAGKKGLNSGYTPVNLVHLQDCISVVKRLIEGDFRNLLFNVCADKHPIHKEFYPAQAIKLGLEPATYTKSVENSNRVLDNSYLKAKTGYRFQYPDPMLFPL